MPLDYLGINWVSDHGCSGRKLDRWIDQCRVWEAMQRDYNRENPNLPGLHVSTDPANTNTADTTPQDK